MMNWSKVENAQKTSFRCSFQPSLDGETPESRYFNVLQKYWTPVCTGVTTFDQTIKDGKIGT